VSAAAPLTSASAFLRACRREPVPRTPVWFMRQAGRALPEYRKLREGVSMLDACTRPELVVEITLQPVRRYGVDAAILFSDIVLPLRSVGVDLDIVPGVGPVIAAPVRTAADVERLRPLTPDAVEYVSQSVRLLVDELGEIPLIGFAGAPFTLASYLIEGGPSRDHAKTKALMLGAPQVWHALLGRLADISAAFLQVQVDAGAAAVQLFDSWAGALALDDYLEYVAPHSRSVLESLGPTGVPRIHFGVVTSELLGAMADLGVEVIGVDWRVPLGEAARRVGQSVAVQGNLDPAVLFAPWEAAQAKAASVLEQGRAASAHIFNLGHGVLPGTDPDTLTRLVGFVHERSGS
jgi:uroporphyrinogen decarboxylase